MSLDALPVSTDEYWDGADTKKIVMSESPRCEHYFVRTKGTEAKCKCGVGYFLSPGMEVKKGHIYLQDKLVI